MALVRAIARPLLASTLVFGGFDSFRNPASKAPMADKVIADLHQKLPVVSSTQQIVQLDGAVKVIAGTMLALGKFPRLSALALIASLVPTTIAGHRPWEHEDPAAKKMHTLQLLKNASMTGGLMLAAVDTSGKPSVGWRTRRALRQAGSAISDTASQIGDKASEITS